MLIRQPNIDNACTGLKALDHIVVIGAGVGGPQALATILTELPSDFPGVVLVVANVGKGFTKVLVEKLSSTSKMPVREAKDGQILRPSRVILIPSEYTANIKMDEDDPCAHVLELQRVSSASNASQKLDVLLNSAAELFGKNAIGAILTGVGNDGLIGAKNIKDAGGIVLVQDEASSICYETSGMVSEAGLANHVTPLWQIATYMMVHTTGESNEYAA